MVESVARPRIALIFGRLAVGEYGQFHAATGVLPDAETCLAVVHEGQLLKIVAASPESATRLRQRRTDLHQMVVVADRGTMVHEALSDGRPRSDGSALKSGAVEVSCARAAPAWEVTALDALLGPWRRSEFTLPSRDHADTTLAQQRANLELADECMADVATIIRAGATGESLVRALEMRLRDAGSVATIVFAGRRAPLQLPQNAPIGRGEVVGVCVEFADASGAWTETAALFSCGAPAKRGLAVADQLNAVLCAGIGLLRPTRRSDEVAAAMLDGLAGPGAVVPFGLGHGVGVDETPPVVCPEDRTELQPGMVVTLHPSVQLADGLTLMVAETVLVTDGEPQPLRRGYESRTAVHVFD